MKLMTLDAALERFCIMSEQKDVGEEKAIEYIKTKLSKDDFTKFQVELYKMNKCIQK